MKSQPDCLNRGEFLNALEHHINGLKQIELDLLVSPRVLAVDAPWGSGKSWIAENLREQLQGEGKSHPVAFIDAFRYDHHDDAFAVIAASILRELKPDAEQKRKFVRAAGAVLKSAVPMIVKGGANLALKAVGLTGDDVKDAAESAIEGASKASEKAVEKLLDRYANTQIVQDEFVKALSSLTRDLVKPFVVIIDELDRCRPSFALEVLERIKHLFAAENVVFVLFWNASSICESVRHSYGQGTDADLYLSKFIAYSVRVPFEVAPTHAPRSRHSIFIRSELRRVLGSERAEQADRFRRSLGEFADYLDASLRDVQKAIRLFKTIPHSENFSESDFALIALLVARKESSLTDFISKDKKFLAHTAARLDAVLSIAGDSVVRDMCLTLTYLSDPHAYDKAFEPVNVLMMSAQQVAVQQVANSLQFPERIKWLFSTAERLRNGLISPEA